MTTARLERRLAKLEARAPAQYSASRRDSLPPLSPEAIRVVLKMLVEMGALIPPPPGHPDHWQELRLALFGPGPLASDDDHEAIG
ncbi:MAG TPA: hypothetical protein VE338_08280 [Ktedonobacterales bacterium]|jgi:hypothetical protein|nr:hypothetical protein [Ktedonobacterales bacterium]